MLSLLLFLVSISFCSHSQQILQQQEYRGTVGKLGAVFNLAWYKDWSVAGSSYYRARQGVTYTFSGNNLKPGELFLYEYSPSKIKPTAFLTLHRIKRGGSVCWNGTLTGTTLMAVNSTHLCARKRTPTPPLTQIKS